MEALSVAVLVPTLRRSEALQRCLAALAAQSRRPDRVLVVARTDDEPTQRVLDAAPPALRIERVPVERPGQVAALNAGLEQAREDVIAITDDDCVPRPEWVAQIVDRFAGDPRLGGLGGPDRLVQDGVRVVGERRQVGRAFWYGRFVGLHHLGTGAARDVELLKGANMSYRRDALAGLRFDPDLRGVGAQPHNDWVFSLAVRAAGWRVRFDPEIAVDHYEAARAEDNPRLSFDRRAATAYVFNQTYAAARYLSRPRLAAHLVYSVLVGTKAAPGLAMTLYALASRSESAGNSLRRAAEAHRTRLAAVRAGAQARRAQTRPAGR